MTTNCRSLHQEQQLRTRENNCRSHSYCTLCSIGLYYGSFTLSARWAALRADDSREDYEERIYLTILLLRMFVGLYSLVFLFIKISHGKTNTTKNNGSPEDNEAIAAL